jgi:hypothetical protein
VEHTPVKLVKFFFFVALFPFSLVYMAGYYAGRDDERKRRR